MILKQPQIERVLGAPDGWTMALLYGPDEGASRALAERVGAALGPDAERIDLDGSTLRDDPDRLPGEANSLTMFGGPRWIRVTAGDEVLKAVELLLFAPRGSPVVFVAGNLTKASALIKLATADPRVVAFASWKPEGDRADAIVRQCGQAIGVRLSSDAARMIAEATNGERDLIDRELEKLALYVDAAADRPRAVDRAEIEAIGAALDVHEPWTLVDALFDGRAAEFAEEIASDAAVEPIPALRAVARRALAIARVHAAQRGGATPHMNKRERDAVERQARTWSPTALVTAHGRASDAEAATKRTGTAGAVLSGQAMLALARAAQRRR